MANSKRSKQEKSAGEDVLTFRRYLEDSKDLFTSLLLILPFFVLYQVGILATGGLRNGVDFMTDLLFAITGGQMLFYLLFNAFVLLGFLGGLLYLRDRRDFHPRTVPFIMLESFVYALLFGGAVTQLMSVFGFGALLASGAGGEMSVLSKLVMSLGAGLYEELVFRLVLMGGTFLAGVKLLKLPRWGAAAIALVFSSLAFSAVHHIGALGDPFTLGVFMFRFFAGVLLAAIFYVRGLAVAVFTHAFYDIIVMVFR